MNYAIRRVMDAFFELMDVVRHQSSPAWNERIDEVCKADIGV